MGSPSCSRKTRSDLSDVRSSILGWWSGRVGRWSGAVGAVALGSLVGGVTVERWGRSGRWGRWVRWGYGAAGVVLGVVSRTRRRRNGYGGVTVGRWWCLGRCRIPGDDITHGYACITDNKGAEGRQVAP